MSIRINKTIEYQDWYLDIEAADRSLNFIGNLYIENNWTQCNIINDKIILTEDISFVIPEEIIKYFERYLELMTFE